MSTATQATQPHEIIWTLTNHVVVSRSVHVVAELGVADHIEDEVVSVKQLASACAADPNALDRVLHLLSTYGIFDRRGDGYAHTDASRLLQSEHPMSMRAYARMIGMPVIRASLDQLEYSVRTGSPATQVVAADGLWPYLAAHDHEREIFGQAMTGKAAADTAAVLGAYDFGRFDTIADIGGGRGHLLRAVLDTTATSEGILFDLPDVIETLEVNRDRLTPRAGDFFVDPLPTADLYILMEVIHDWPDAEAAAILTAVRRAASPGARVLIIENVLDDTSPDPRGHTLDIIIVAVHGRSGTNRDSAGRALESCRLPPQQGDHHRGPLHIVEAVVAGQDD
jgi:hypothetical protein